MRYKNLTIILYVLLTAFSAVQLRRSMRNRAPRQAPRDAIPEEFREIHTVEADDLPLRQPNHQAQHCRVRLIVKYHTEQNKFRLQRTYEADPRPRVIRTPTSRDSSEPHFTPNYAPYPNYSAWRLGSWYHNGVQKSGADLKALLAILQDPKFSTNDINSARWERTSSLLGRGNADAAHSTALGNGWQSSPVTIKLPTAPVQELTVPDVKHRSITSVMDQVRGHDSASQRFNNIPYEQMWQPHNLAWPKERVFCELASSMPFAELYRSVQNAPQEPGCQLERVADIFILGSDSMALTAIGGASLWPVYLFWANQSKYELADRSSGACHTVAYLEKVRSWLYLGDYFTRFSRFT